MTFAEWEAGDLPDSQALRTLAMDLGELESELAPLNAQRERLRDQLSRVLVHAGGKADIPGFGALIITDASITKSYDTKALDELIIRLTGIGESEIAQQIAACRRESGRAGSLRITRERGTK